MHKSVGAFPWKKKRRLLLPPDPALNRFLLLTVMVAIRISESSTHAKSMMLSLVVIVLYDIYIVDRLFFVFSGGKIK